MPEKLISIIEKLNSKRIELQAIIKFLSKFETDITNFETEKIPTIHLVWVAIKQMELNLTEMIESNSLHLKVMGKSCKLVLQHKLDQGIYIYIYTYITY